MKETCRQQRDRINNLLMNIPSKTDQERSKIYSWVRLQENIIQEYNPLLNLDKRYFVRYCKKCESFTCHYGENCATCRSKKTGLGNPDIHTKTIKTQMDRGTFNMLDPEIQKNKISNKNLLYRHENIFCDQCKEITSHRVWPDGKKRCCKCDFKNNGISLQFCEACKRKTLQNGKYCVLCHPESVNNNFLPSLTNIQGMRHYYDASMKKYVPWNEYKKKFMSLSDRNSTEKILLEHPYAKMIPTFLEQNSTSWVGTRMDFEQYLVTNGYSWFAYIKLFVNSKGDLKPLVSGKTGSLLVNISGTDISFSMNPSDGVSRIYLKESGLSWCKTHIIIIPCETEEDSLILEQSFKTRYSLFGS